MTNKINNNQQNNEQKDDVFPISNRMNLESRIEGVLFYKSEPVKKIFLAEFFDISPEELEAALELLSVSTSSSGLRLTITDTTVQLVTAPELSGEIEKLRTEELSRDIGKAGSETLAIIIYRGPITRAGIDRVRGVNSTFIIRNLMMRGLIERRTNSHDSRSFLYASTPALLQHLGVEKREDLLEFENIMNALDTFEQEDELESKNENLFVN